MTRDLLGVHLVNVLTPTVQALVDNAEEVEITTMGRDTVIVSVLVAQQDRGQVIGRQGKTAEALRTIVTAISAKHRMRAILEIVEG